MQRKHASFFDWFKREKEIKEIGITRMFLENIEKFEIAPFHSLQVSPEDPPDVLAKNQAGEPVGIEVCELVDEEVVRQWERGEEVFRFWEKQELTDFVQQIINRKDAKTFHGGPYDKIYLLIHTDEPLLDYETFGIYLSEYEFQKPNKINEAFLFFSYSPKIGYCPYIHLKFQLSGNQPDGV